MSRAHFTDHSMMQRSSNVDHVSSHRHLERAIILRGLSQEDTAYHGYGP